MRKLTSYSLIPPFFLLAVDVIVFGSLLVNKYIVFTDFSTVPQFGSISASQFFFNSSNRVNETFSPILIPGFSVVETFLSLIFGKYAINITALTVILIYSFGSYVFLRHFAGPNKALIGALIATLNPGVFNVIFDSPSTLYVAFLPLFMATYWSYRVEEKGHKYLMLSGAVLAFSTIYGPVVPLILGSLLSIEVYVLIKKGEKQIKKSIVSSVFVLALFAIFHFGILLNYQTLLSTYTAQPSIISSGNFSLLQVITFGAVRPYEQQFYNVIPYYFSIIIIITSALVFLILLRNIISNRKLFPLFYFTMIASLSAYGTNFLGIYSLFDRYFPIFSAIDPFEYSPLIGLVLAIFYCNYTPKASSEKVSKYRKSFNKILSLTKERSLKRNILTAFVIFIVVLSGAATSQFYYNAWRDNTVPPQFVNAYDFLHLSSGVQLIVPSTYAIEFDFYHNNFTVLGKEYTYLQSSTPYMLYYASPPTFISPPISDNSYPYNLLYKDLYGHNSTSFQALANILDIANIVYFNSTTYSSTYDSPTFASLVELENITGFVLVKNFGNNVFILKNDNLSSNPIYKMSINNQNIGISSKNDTKFLVTPIPYNYAFTASDNVKVSDWNGLVALRSGSNFTTVVLTSTVALYNMAEEIVTVIFIALSVLFFLSQTDRRKRRIKHIEAYVTTIPLAGPYSLVSESSGGEFKSLTGRLITWISLLIPIILILNIIAGLNQLGNFYLGTGYSFFFLGFSYVSFYLIFLAILIMSFDKGIDRLWKLYVQKRWR